MIVHASVIKAGPRGNKCRKCKNKAKAPSLILKAQGEYNRFSGFVSEDKFCSDCGVQKLDEGIERLKELKSILIEGPRDEEKQLGRTKRKVVA